MAVFQKLRDKRITYAIPTFDGGLNNKYSPQELHDSESPDLLNVDFDDVGSVGTRKGSLKLNTSAIATQPIDGLFVTNWQDGTQTMVAFCNGTAYTTSATTEAAFAAISGSTGILTAGSRVYGTQFYNVAFFGNGSAEPYKYNGTNWSRMGVPTPASGHTAGTNSAGTLTGDYRYKISYINSYSVEGEVGTANDTFTAASEDIALTGIPVPPASYGCDTKWIYRTKASGAVFYQVAEISAAVTSYTDNVDDTALVVSAPVDASVPPKFNKCVTLMDRLFMNNPDYPDQVFYSEALNPFVVPLTNYIVVNKGDGEKIIDLAVNANNIVIFKENSIWTLNLPDNDDTNWSLQRTIAEVGGAGFNCSIPYNASGSEVGLGFIGQHRGKISGIHLFTGRNLAGSQQMTLVGNSVSEKIEPWIDDIDWDYRSKISVIMHNDKIYFAVPYVEAGDSSQATNNYILLWDYNRRSVPGSLGSFVPWKGINASCFAIYQGDLYAGSSASDGFVRKLLRDTYTDDGTLIDSYIWTKMFRGPKNMERNRKDFRYWYIWHKTLPQEYNMQLNYRNLGDQGVGDSYNIDMYSGGSVWGSFIWGDSIWGAGLENKQSRGSFGKTSSEGIQLKFQNVSATSDVSGTVFRVYRADFDFNLLQPR